MNMLYANGNFRYIRRWRLHRPNKPQANNAFREGWKCFVKRSRIIMNSASLGWGMDRGLGWHEPKAGRKVHERIESAASA